MLLHIFVELPEPRLETLRLTLPLHSHVILRTLATIVPARLRSRVLLFVPALFLDVLLEFSIVDITSAVINYFIHSLLSPLRQIIEVSVRLKNLVYKFVVLSLPLALAILVEGGLVLSLAGLVEVSLSILVIIIEHASVEVLLLIFVFLPGRHHI